MVKLATSVRSRIWRALPLTLAVAMLAVVVLAGLLPDTGVVSASSSCTYGKCPASQPFPLWAVSLSIAVVIIALIAALLLLRRSRRRRPPAGDAEAGAAAGGTTAEGAQGWSEGSEGGEQSQQWSEGPESGTDSGASPPSGDDGESAA